MRTRRCFSGVPVAQCLVLFVLLAFCLSSIALRPLISLRHFQTVLLIVSSFAINPILLNLILYQYLGEPHYVSVS